MSIQFRLLDFNVYNEKNEEESVKSPTSQGSYEYKKKIDTNEFIIQLFGLDDKGKTYCIYIDNFRPHFYIKVESHWNKTHLSSFEMHLKRKIKDYYADSILSCELVRKQ